MCNRELEVISTAIGDPLADLIAAEVDSGDDEAIMEIMQNRFGIGDDEHWLYQVG